MKSEKRLYRMPSPSLNPVMNPEEMRMKIAEACGWKDCHQSKNWAATIGTLHEVNGNAYAVLPDYLNDLNAMHEAEKHLTPKQSERYAFALVSHNRRALGIPDHQSHYPVQFVIHATAAQRAAAFVNTITA